MKALTLEETGLFDEMKERCLAKGQYKDEKAKDKFKMLCHLEDFMIQYWELLKENEILKQNAENNDKVVDKINWENQLLKKENQKLKERIEYLERSNNRREDTILEQRQEISDLEDNWNKLKEYLHNVDVAIDYSENYDGYFINYDELIDKMQELEQGSDE